MADQTQPEPYYPHLEKYLERAASQFLEPFSTKSEPFTDWPRQAYSFVTDDFCHEKAFVAKFTTKTGRSQIKIKETVNTNSKKTTYQLADEVKLWFSLPNAGTLYTKVKSNDYIKLHYDHGVRSYNGRNLYFFGGVNSSKLLNNIDFRIGFGYISPNSNIENRLKVTRHQENNRYHWYHKTFFVRNNYRFGFLGVADLTNLVLQKNNLLFGWNIKPNTQGFLRAQVSGFREKNIDIKRVDTIFDTVTADLVHKLNDKSRVALEVSFDIQKRALGDAKAVYQFEYEKKKFIKASLNSKLNVALLAKIPLYGLEDFATISAGIGVNGLSTKDIGVKTGFQVQFNS